MCFARCHVSSSFRMVNEPSLEYLSLERLSMQSPFEHIAPLVFKALRGMAPMYMQDLLQVKTQGRHFLRSDALGLQKVPHTCMVQELWRPRICCCCSQIPGTAVLLLSQIVILLIILEGTWHQRGESLFSKDFR